MVIKRAKKITTIIFSYFLFFLNIKLFNIFHKLDKKKIMKKILFILIIVLTTSCKSSINYLKDGEFKELKMPYSVKDYPDSSEEFYSIVNASGTNLNINRNRALLEAKTYLSGRIKTIINSVANQKLSFNNDIESEEFDQKATSVSNQSIQKIIKVDSKIYKQKSGDKYDLWVVYKVSLDDVVTIINDSVLGFDISTDDISNVIDETVDDISNAIDETVNN